MIEFKNISFNYKGSDDNGIKDINLIIRKGETLLITGESGCGKTTITRLLNGLIPHFFEGELTGEITMDSINITKESIYYTSKYVGSVFQNPRSQFFNVDTTSELAFAPENQGVPIEEITNRIHNVVVNFNIFPLMDRSIFQLSGGEKQKIACASVSVAESEIIVLDEPSSNLDIKAIEDLRRMIQHWKSEGKTIIVAEHRLYFMRELADRMIIMKNGKIEEELYSEQIKQFSSEESKLRGIRILNMDQLSYSRLNFPNPSNSSQIKITDLCYQYSNSNLGINIDSICVEHGTVIAVIGDNGAGKSTFAKCLCGLHKKCKGTLEINNHTYSARKGLDFCYMVMQDVNHQLFTESVEDEIILSMPSDKNVSDEDKEAKVNHILAALNLLSFKEKHPMALSGGQKQRVAIASALAAQKDILFFDEPTSGLDYQHMLQVSDCIHNLSLNGKTVFIITHDLELILNCCSDIIHLEAGKLKDHYKLTQNSLNKFKSFFCQFKAL